MSEEMWRILEQKYCNPDGSFRDVYLEGLQKRGYTSEQIAEMEWHSIREAESARYEREALARQREQTAARRKALRQQIEEDRQKGVRECVITYSSYAVDTSSMNEDELHRFRMAGLDSEELITQGFAEADDF